MGNVIPYILFVFLLQFYITENVFRTKIPKIVVKYEQR